MPVVEYGMVLGGSIDYDRIFIVTQLVKHVLKILFRPFKLRNERFKVYVFQDVGRAHCVGGV